MSIMHCSLLSLGCAFGFSPYADQRNLTGLRALKIAQRRLRPEVRAKLLSVTSARSGANLTPEAWRFVFLDPATSGHCRIVTVAAKASSEHPDTVEAFSSIPTENVSSAHVISQNKLQVDSEQALIQTRSASKLKGIRAAEYRLSQGRSGQEPVWMLTFFSESSDPVAQIQVGAKLGAVKILQK
ncbi:MAG TPA: hypothetical protein VGC39_11130 [Candidatus Methylacidiphilales bacterium]